MTEIEARRIMKSHGWFYTERCPKGVAKYIYAKRRQGSKMAQRYICPLLRLGELTEEQLVVKLTQPPAKGQQSPAKEP